MALSSDTQIVIQPTRGLSDFALGELWTYREVIFFLAWRTIKVRYKQTIFGAAWAIIQPLVTMAVFTVIFGRIAKVPTDGIPYPIFVFAALLPWQFFASSISAGSDSLIGGGGILKQVYFPRLAMPLASTCACLVDFLIAFAVMFGLMIYFAYYPTLSMLVLPLLVILLIAASLGVSLVLSAMNVKFRDVKHATPFMLQVWMYCTPVVYPLRLIEDPLIASIYTLNPMVGIVEGFRWALLGVGEPPVQPLLISATVCLVMLVVGTLYFKKMERNFADVV